MNLSIFTSVPFAFISNTGNENGPRQSQHMQWVALQQRNPEFRKIKFIILGCEHSSPLFLSSKAIHCTNILEKTVQIKTHSLPSPAKHSDKKQLIENSLLRIFLNDYLIVNLLIGFPKSNLKWKLCVCVCMCVKVLLDVEIKKK